MRAYGMLPNGTVAKETSRVFTDLNGSEPGVPDGIKLDTSGNLYSAGSGGLFVIDPQGKKLGRIVHGQSATTNVAFGGDDWKTLYFTTRSTLFSVAVKIAGVPVPLKKSSDEARLSRDDECLVERHPLGASALASETSGRAPIPPGCEASRELPSQRNAPGSAIRCA